MKKQKYMWEILVPYKSNVGKKYSLKYHKEWDEYVKNISNGLSIHKTVKGEWLSPDGCLFKDKMIVVRIICTEKEINKIATYTLIFYDQNAVIFYRISDYVRVIYKHK